MPASTLPPDIARAVAREVERARPHLFEQGRREGYVSSIQFVTKSMGVVYCGQSVADLASEVRQREHAKQRPPVAPPPALLKAARRCRSGEPEAFRAFAKAIDDATCAKVRAVGAALGPTLSREAHQLAANITREKLEMQDLPPCGYSRDIHLKAIELALDRGEVELAHAIAHLPLLVVARMISRWDQEGYWREVYDRQIRGLPYADTE